MWGFDYSCNYRRPTLTQLLLLYNRILSGKPDVMKPEHIFGNSTKEMEYYGTGVDLDRMITVAQSGELLDLMIDFF
jgi:hypothetical protein